VNAWISGASNALSETFRSSSGYSRSGSRFSRLRRMTMDKPLEKRQSLGPRRVIAQGHRNTLRDAEDEQRTCVLRFGQHKIAGLGTESTSTCCRRLGKGSHGDLIRMEIGPSMLTLPDRALRRSPCPYSGAMKGSRKRSNARRGGCTIPNWPRALRT
jgi:hypothetical protein